MPPLPLVLLRDNGEELMTNLERAAAVERAEMRACKALQAAGFDAGGALERALNMGADELSDDCLTTLDGVGDDYWADYAAESVVAEEHAKMPPPRKHNHSGKRKPRGMTNET